MPHSIQRQHSNDDTVSFSCLILSGILFLFIAFMPATRSIVLRLYRPIIIAVMLFLCKKRKYALTRAHVVLFVFLALYIFVFLLHPITYSSTWSFISILLFVFFFLSVSTVSWNKRELFIIFFAIIIASDLFVLEMFRSNPELRTGEQVAGLKFFSGSSNTNTAAFQVVSGGVLSFFLLLFGPQKTALKVFSFLSYVLIGALLFCISCRSAFYSYVVASVILMFTLSNKNNGRYRTTVKLGVVLLVAVFFIVGSLTTEDSVGSRLFNKEELTDDNGRDDLAERAKELIAQKPIFGGGLDYWDSESGMETGTHNSFLTTMVESGFVGGALFAFFLLLFLMQIASAKSSIAFALITEALFHTMTEPSMDYYFYIPITLSMIVMYYSNAHRVSGDKIFTR